jgi:hypothetical protein
MVMENESVKSINRNIMNVGFGICIFILFCFTIYFTIHASAEKERFETSQKSIQILIAKIDTLRNEIKDYHLAIQKADTIKNNRYAEQCRVDSIQDAFLDKVNVRTIPLLMNQN